MKTCRTCHFLAKSHVDLTGREFTFTWDEAERVEGAVADHYAAECAQGVWSTRIDPAIQLEARAGNQSATWLLLHQDRAGHVVSGGRGRCSTSKNEIAELGGSA